MASPGSPGSRPLAVLCFPRGLGDTGALAGVRGFDAVDWLGRGAADGVVVGNDVPFACQSGAN